MTLIFATGNPNKVHEIMALVPQGTKVIGLKEVGIVEDIPEEEPTLEGNALAKARYVFERTGMPCFADDTGLEVKALNGEPGVLSARYAGPEKDPEKNMDLLLQNLSGMEDRSARFRTVIAMVSGKGEWTFEGEVKGLISFSKKGEKGFGYDPIFIPEGETRSFAEMTLAEKNQMSHRARAFRKFKRFLEDHS